MSTGSGTASTFRNLGVGDPVPWFRQNCTSNPNYAFDMAGGRYVVLCFYATAADEVGREVSFPEYGPRGYKAPAGGAVVFSCSLLHAVSRVTEGERFAFLPFIYDDEAARIREANNAHLGDEVAAYRA